MLRDGMLTCDGCRKLIDPATDKIGTDYMAVWHSPRYWWRFVTKWGYHEHKCKQCGWPKSATVGDAIATAVKLLTPTD